MTHEPNSMLHGTALGHFGTFWDNVWFWRVMAFRFEVWRFGELAIGHDTPGAKMVV